MAKEQNASGLKVIEPVNDRFSAAVGYRNYHLLKKSFRYDDSIAHGLQKMAKNIAVQVKDFDFPWKEPIPVISF